MFQFGNWAPVAGKPAVREALRRFFASIGGLSHEFTGEWRDTNTVVLEGNVTYTRLNGTTVTVPAATVYELDGELASQVRIYVDVGPALA